MKTYYYYAGLDMPRFEKPQHETLCDSQLTDEMLKWVIAQCASGVPPFKVIIPRCIAWEFSRWNVPPNLLTVQIIEGKPFGDASPCDTARIIFDDCEVQIVCRRVIPVAQAVWDCGIVSR